MSQNHPRLQINLISRQEAKISFGNEVLSWNVFPYFKGVSNYTYDVFEQINDFISTLSQETHKTLFESYKKIWKLLDLPPITLDQDLKVAVTELLNQIDVDRVKNWIDLHANVVIPSALSDVYVDTDENTGNRNRTYIKEDYRWLIAMSTVLRLMTPVWGEYIAKTNKEKGNNYKEYYAAKLIEDTRLMSSVPMTKLKLFILENIPKDKSVNSVILAAFSEEDFPDWILGLILVRKLTLEDIRGVNSDSHLIQVVFQNIRHCIKTVDSRFYGIIKEKFIPNSTTSLDDSNNLSKIEGYKIRQEIPAGDVALIRMSLQDPYRIADKLSPGIPRKLVKESIESVLPLELQFITRPQRTILQYVLKPVCPPSGVMLLNKKDLVRNLGVAQAVLWYTKWYDIAALLTGVVLPHDDYMSIGYSGVKNRITKVQFDKLEYLYPYKRRPQGKQRIAKNQNVAVSIIEKLSDAFMNNDWKLSIPQHWLNEASLDFSIKRFTTPSDIRVKIADFVIAIAENDLPFKIDSNK